MLRGQRRPRGKSVHAATASPAQRPPQLKDLRDLKTSAAHTPPLLKDVPISKTSPPQRRPHFKDLPSSKTSPFQRRPQHLFWVRAKKKMGRATARGNCHQPPEVPPLGHHFAAVLVSQIVEAFEIPAVCPAPASARKTLQNAAKTPFSDKSADQHNV